MRRNIAVLLCIVLISAICISCGGYEVTEMPLEAVEEETVDVGKKVGVLMPTKTDERWEHDAENIKKALEASGYEVKVEFAENNSFTQEKQMQEMLEEQIDCLVISAVDSAVLLEELEKAKEENISIIAYDRLLMNTEAVSYYATFDNRSIGVSMGTYIKEQAQLDKLREQGGQKTIEFFMGSPSDNNAIIVYEGIMEVLGEYLIDGTLVSKSSKTEFEDSAVEGWSGEQAEKNATQILESHYKEDSLDIVCSANDTMASGVIASLEKCGYTQENWPIITGQDAGVEAVKNIIGGKQSMSVHKDTRVLADKCATMVKAVLEGTVPEINNENEYNNGKFKVKSYLCTPIVVDKKNYREILIDGGYYNEEELK